MSDGLYDLSFEDVNTYPESKSSWIPHIESFRHNMEEDIRRSCTLHTTKYKTIDVLSSEAIHLAEFMSPVSQTDSGYSLHGPRKYPPMLRRSKRTLTRNASEKSRNNKRSGTGTLDIRNLAEGLQKSVTTSMSLAYRPNYKPI
ncbi:hypothetical protein BGX26_001355 [Mortierella sp. AD094]|nr:hypothetical protein BGX26_001355 [Mortierella sp. AD094]